MLIINVEGGFYYKFMHNNLRSKVKQVPKACPDLYPSHQEDNEENKCHLLLQKRPFNKKEKPDLSPSSDYSLSHNKWPHKNTAIETTDRLITKRLLIFKY